MKTSTNQFHPIHITCSPNRVLRLRIQWTYSPLSTLIYTLQITLFLRLLAMRSFSMVTLKTVRNRIQCYKMCHCDLSYDPKRKQVLLPSVQIFFFYRGSTFSEEELYFTNPIFKGQIQQDNDLFLLDLSIQPFLNLCILPLLTFPLRKPRKILSGDGCPWA
jgi:hypothetical protein